MVRPFDGDVTAQVVEAPTVDAAKAEEGKDSSSTDAKDSTDKSSDASGKGALSEEEAKDLSGWMKTALSARVSEVATTNRLVDSPAIISDHDNAVTRRMMQVPSPRFSSLRFLRPASIYLVHAID